MEFQNSGRIVNSGTAAEFCASGRIIWGSSRENGGTSSTAGRMGCQGVERLGPTGDDAVGDHFVHDDDGIDDPVALCEKGAKEPREVDERDGGRIDGKRVDLGCEIGEERGDNSFRGNYEEGKMEGKHMIVDETHAEEGMKERHN